MNFELYQIFLIGAVYLTFLFGIAYVTDRGWLPLWLTDNPLVYVLSLCVFASAWAFYGVIDLANEYGYGALSYYMGAGGLFIFAPLILTPLFRLTRLYQLRSLADVFTFRFRSHWVGTLTTLFMLFSILPLLAMQIQAVADTALIMTYNPKEDTSDIFAFHDKLALVFCATTMLFTVLFGSQREQHRGLVVAMAVESAVKMLALVAIGLFAIIRVFGGLDGLENWLTLHPEHLETLYKPVNNTTSHMLVLLFFATAICFPDVFHMGFSENRKIKTLDYASWGIPLYLLIISLPIFPILWAGFQLSSSVTPDYFTLGVPLSAWRYKLTIIAYLGGLSAATGAMVVMALAMSTMSLNHLLLPFYQPRASNNLYKWLILLRRILIVVIISAGYLFYQLLNGRQGLTDLVIITCVESIQFIPGVFAVLYWPGANGKGYLAGLISGTLVWFAGLMLPMLTGIRFIDIPFTTYTLPIGMEQWHIITLLGLGVNTLLFALVSRFSHASPEEKRAAELCTMEDITRPLRLELDIDNVADMRNRLADALGEKIAEEEIRRALDNLEQSESDNRPYALRRLRDQIEANLSGLMGVAVAHTLMDRIIPYHTNNELRSKEDIHFVENRINQYRQHLTGLAAELDNLRRYHRETLENLPMAVCSLGDDGEILLWNREMERLTGIDTNTVLGSHIRSLEEPWKTLVSDFLQENSNVRKQKIMIDGLPRWINLHKANVDGRDAQEMEQDGHVIMLEDLTETQRLEEELLHNERLASIGRLAAGVAHEIGNPVTGIACLAQNLKYETETEEISKVSQQILSQTDRISRIVHSLVHFAHAGNEEAMMTAVDMHECVAEAIQLLSLQKDRIPVRYRNDIAPGIMVEGDVQRLTQVFVNLLSNARDASPANGDIIVSAHATGTVVDIHVRDFGHGIDERHIKRLFDPFFTTKPAGKGTGLGLSMVYSIVEEHFGHIEVLSPVADGGGTEFIITLPQHQNESLNKQEPETRS